MVRPYQPVDVADVLIAHDAARPRSRQTALARADGRWGVGPSDIGRCRRAIMYRERPPADLVVLPESQDRALAKLVGTIVHDGIARTLKRRRRNVMVEVSVPIPGFEVDGHVDLFEPRVGRVTDWKITGSEWAWDKLALGPFANDADQGHVYAFGLEEAGHDVRTVRVTYVRTFSNHATKGKPRTESFEMPYDRGRALAAVDWLHNVIDALDTGAELPRDRKGPDLDGICAECPFRATCWELDAAEEAKRTPYGWLVARDDPAIELALEDYDAARAEESKHKEIKSAVRDALTGVEPGRYGQMEVSFGRENVTWVDDPEAWARALVAEMEQARAENRPPVPPSAIGIPQRPKRTGGAISVKRVRAAQLAEEGVAVAAVAELADED